MASKSEGRTVGSSIAVLSSWERVNEHFRPVEEREFQELLLRFEGDAVVSEQFSNIKGGPVCRILIGNFFRVVVIAIQLFN